MESPDKVLIADDDLSVRSVIKYSLETEGFTVIEACDGNQCLGLVKEENPDLLLLDYHMPGLDGLDVLQQLKSGIMTKSLPVIMLTANYDKQLRLEGLQAGANDFLNKPFSNDELMLRVRNTLQLNQKHRDANPLTGLPGNHAIEQELELRIKSKSPYALLYIDMDNFKSYNDYYGYSRGDRMLTLLADVLSESVQEHGDNNSFLGHVGGDDFVIIAAPEQAVKIATISISKFDSKVKTQYDPEDWARGYLELKDRQGRVDKFPPASITIAMVADKTGEYSHAGVINAIVAELKKYGKGHAGSVLVQERRNTRSAERCELVYAGGIDA